MNSSSEPVPIILIVAAFAVIGVIYVLLYVRRRDTSFEGVVTDKNILEQLAKKLQILFEGSAGHQESQS